MPPAVGADSEPRPHSWASPHRVPPPKSPEREGQQRKPGQATPGEPRLRTRVAKARNEIGEISVNRANPAHNFAAIGVCLVQNPKPSGRCFYAETDENSISSRSAAPPPSTCVPGPKCRVPGPKPSRVPGPKPSRVPGPKPSRVPSPKCRVPGPKPPRPGPKPSRVPGPKPSRVPGPKKACAWSQEIVCLVRKKRVPGPKKSCAWSEIAIL